MASTGFNVGGATRAGQLLGAALLKLVSLDGLGLEAVLDKHAAG